MNPSLPVLLLRPKAVLLAGIACLCCTSVFAQSTEDYADKSIEELINIDVTSVARKDQKLSKTPAAVYVITQEAIQRSGARVIPELLRLAPGVQVAQVDGSRWAISVRGFNGTYSNKLLVLVDGRTVYTPSFSGVYWDQMLEIPLNTIDRIEVVRGPGGAVWGANAVNGVINIITKRASETKGGKVSVQAGSSGNGDYLVQYGGAFKDAYKYRVFEQFDNFEGNRLPDGQPGQDGWHSNSGGFRLDKGDERTSKDSFFAEGNYYRNDGTQLLTAGQFSAGQDIAQPVTDDGFDVTARWSHHISDRADTTLQIYENHYDRQDSGILEHNNTADVDFQNHLQWGSRNDIVWGAGYRFAGDNYPRTFTAQQSLNTLGYAVQVIPAAKTYSLVSTFFQDEIRLATNWSFTAGSKLEHNAFTGFQYEPTLRLAWTPNDSSTFWIAASQANRQPSRLETGLDLHIAPLAIEPGVYLNPVVLGNPQLLSERMRDYEIGYRIMPNDRISFDVSSFFSLYRDLTSSGLLPPSVEYEADGVHLVLPVQYQNGFKSEDYGVEFVSTWNVAARWKLSGNYAWARVLPSLASPGQLPNLQGLPPGIITPQSIQEFNVTDPISAAVPPENQVGFQSYLDLSSKLSFDSSVYFVGRLNSGNVPSYTRFDSRLHYKFNRHFEAGIAGQNLLSPYHSEFAQVVQIVSTEVPRTIFGNVIWAF